MSWVPDILTQFKGRQPGTSGTSVDILGMVWDMGKLGPGIHFEGRQPGTSVDVLGVIWDK